MNWFELQVVSYSLSADAFYFIIHNSYFIIPTCRLSLARGLLEFGVYAVSPFQ